MGKSDSRLVAVIGGGPGGSSAALCLRKLGRDVVVYEKQKFPRYRIGESLLPGTMSILKRLDAYDKVAAASFPVKRAATFIWGGDRPPWSFTFATPKTAPWVFDHALQVTRSEYDQILLDTAAERGARVKQLHEVSSIDFPENGGPVKVGWTNGGSSGEQEADFIIDASGARGMVAKKLKLRQWDEYYRNMAIWSYFKGGKRYKGDLEGNIFSVTFKEGWIWIIPLKDDIYSVGVVTAIENNDKIRELGKEEFFRSCLAMCPLATEILATAEQCDEVRLVREWAYDSKQLSVGPAFLCGDSACFIDPLFSQGVHLATYSGMLAAAAIDYLYDHPDAAPEVHSWYDTSYREAYQRYHRFLAAFYACNEEPGSKFWDSRKIDGAGDQRFGGKEWFTSLTGQNVEAGAEGIEELEQGAATLADLWQHSTKDLDDEFDQTELSTRRVRWANDLFRDFRRMAAVRWVSKEACLVPSFKVDPTTFKLQRQFFIGDENGRVMRSFALTAEHRDLFNSLRREPLSFRQLSDQLKRLGGQGTPLQIVGRLVEQHFLSGFDKEGNPVKIRSALRFGGVGAEDDLS